jgi:putative flavoprotein involved in K+ transport
MTDPRRIPVAIVGGGQAGLSASRELVRRGVAHVVLERSRAFHSWREDRWDTFCLVTPNWQCRLPDWPYRGDDPHGFMPKDEIVAYLEGFAASFDPPLREGVAVTRLSRRGAGFALETSEGPWLADQVVIATGGYHDPIVPPYAAALDPGVVQMQSKDYRRPSQLPGGATLVVGTGQSGVQIMEDLHLAGRQAHLAVGPAPRSPRRYRGRDATDWLYDMGHYDLTIDRHPDPERAVSKTNHYMSGRDGGHEIDLRRFALQGVRLYGSVAGMEGRTIRFLPDLEKNLDDADASYCAIRDAIDGWIAAQGIDAPPAAPFEKVWRPDRETEAIDVAEAGVTSVIWAIGFRPDWSWIDLPVFENGRPRFRRGVCDVAGIYFLGLGWLNTWGSGRLLGVGDDAAYLAERIAERAARSAPFERAS